MKKAILLIDGENFQYKVEQIIKDEKITKDKVDISSIRLDQLIHNAFKKYKEINIIEKRYYAAKLHEYKETLTKSKQLISSQRKLKNNLEKRKFSFITAGHVRAQFIQVDRHKRALFKEKGVDVKIAVDMISFACDKKADILILCSSDSDLQPAVKEARNRKIEVIYLGFSINPNKGLTFTTNKTILFRNSEILVSVSKQGIK